MTDLSKLTEDELQELLKLGYGNERKNRQEIEIIRQQLHQRKIKRLGKAGRIETVEQQNSCFNCHYMTIEFRLDYDDYDLMKIDAKCLLESGYKENAWAESAVRILTSKVCPRWLRRSLITFKELEQP